VLPRVPCPRLWRFPLCLPRLQSPLVDGDRVLEDLLVVMTGCLKARVSGRRIGIRC
jgi:hypothetical protein